MTKELMNEIFETAIIGIIILVAMGIRRLATVKFWIDLVLVGVPMAMFYILVSGVIVLAK